MQQYDFLVVGAGIAGASAAAYLAETHRTLIVEMEDRPGYHTTGRSAASYEPNYGPPPMLAFTRASEKFFRSPPNGFADSPLLLDRPSLFIEAEGQEEHTADLLAKASALDEISRSDAMELFPVFRPEYVQRAFLDRFTADMDVDLIHRGFLKMFKAKGGETLLSAPITAITRRNGLWHIKAGGHDIAARVIINAAGAWGDGLAALASVPPVGLVPKRRSIGVIPFEYAQAWQHWPMVVDVSETWYAKPQSGKMIVSSADATPVEPHDAYADDMAIAEGVERLMTATTIEVTRIEHSWGGLRTFAPDGNPVIGFDPQTEDFFWLVGQGGYGIQSAPSLGESAAALARGLSLPPNVMGHGLNLKDISPERFRSHVLA
jgi:D-arginine dehydrogenase